MPVHSRLFHQPPQHLAQARRVSSECIFMLLGELMEHSRTDDMFLTPKNPKTAEYIEGRYG